MKKDIKYKLGQCIYLTALLFILTGVFGNTFPVSVKAAVTDKDNGWVQESSGDRYYYKNGKIAKNQLLVLGKNIYYVDKNGKCYTGWKTVKGKTYYFDKDGRAHKGWLSEKDTWYYFNEQSCYLYKDILLVSGSGKIYIFDKDGKRYTGWCEYKGKKYYIGGNGYALMGLYKIGDKYYCFDSKSGYLYTDKLVTMNSGNIYYFDENGVRVSNCWVSVKSGGKTTKYYFQSDGTAKKGWMKWDGKWYYLHKKTGAMYRNTTITTSAGKKYIFDSNGVCTNKK